MKNKNAFSFVELIVVITILAFLSIAVFKISSDSKDNTSNLKVEADILSLSNSFSSILTESNKLSLPAGNQNYFKNNWAYSHENFEDSENPAFWVYGKVTEDTISKKYISEVPKDPRTWQYYSYGVLSDLATFEIAWVTWQDSEYRAKVTWNYTWDKWVIWLIRAYNWPDFVIDWWESLPFNPEKILLSATDRKWNIFNDWDIITFSSANKTFAKNGTQIEAEITKLDYGDKKDLDFYELYFSDWTIWRVDLTNDFKITLWKENEQLTFEKNWLVSKINMFLEAWKLWVFAPNQWKESELSVWTMDLTAAVRWTIFSVDAKSWVEVQKWTVEVTNKSSGSTQNLEWTKDSFYPWLKSDAKVENEDTAGFDYEDILLQEGDPETEYSFIYKLNNYSRWCILKRKTWFDSNDIEKIYKKYWEEQKNFYDAFTGICEWKEPTILLEKEKNEKYEKYEISIAKRYTTEGAIVEYIVISKHDDPNNIEEVTEINSDKAIYNKDLGGFKLIELKSNLLEKEYLEFSLKWEYFSEFSTYLQDVKIALKNTENKIDDNKVYKILYFNPPEEKYLSVGWKAEKQWQVSPEEKYLFVLYEWVIIYWKIIEGNLLEPNWNVYIDDVKILQ